MKINENGYPLWDTEFKSVFDYYLSFFNTELEKLCNDLLSADPAYAGLCGAMRYSLGAGGKRVRPMLVFEFCRICGGDIKDAVAPALAIEMIHTFSLIHDDLPCMDDDDMRRGRPSCHKAYGEAQALLAGDALSILACGIIAKQSDGVKAAGMINTLCKNTFGMICGQTIDIKGCANNIAALKQMYALKTSCLIEAACVMGCIAGGAEEMSDSAVGYAKNLGLAFQFIDDILDVTADEKELGKPVHSDEQQNKITSVTVLGLSGAETAAEEYTDAAKQYLKVFSHTDFLEELTDMLLKRKK